MLSNSSSYSGNLRTHSTGYRKSERRTAANDRSGTLCSAHVEDLASNPGTHAPSLRHTDSGTTSHLPDRQSGSRGEITSAGSDLAATENELQLWVLASIAFAIFYAN